ncbi:mitochondrial ribosomal protein L55 [Aphomia sociella]
MYNNLMQKFKISITSLCIHNRYLNNNVPSITKIHREVYTRMYPTRVVLADGASINIRYHEPRKIIKLPLNLSSLSEEERRNRLERRKPKIKVKITDDLEDNFNAKKYLKYMKKGKK